MGFLIYGMSENRHENGYIFFERTQNEPKNNRIYKPHISIMYKSYFSIYRKLKAIPAKKR